MFCPNCESNVAGYVKSVAKEVGGEVKFSYWCDVCPREEEASIAIPFPNFIVRGGSKVSDSNQRRVEELPDYRQRQRDDVSRIDDKDTFIFAAHGSPKVTQVREQKKIEKFNAKFGAGNWKQVSDDGVVARAEKVRREENASF